MGKEVVDKVRLSIFESYHEGKITSEDKDRLLSSFEEITEASAQDKFYRNRDAEFDANVKKKEIAERMLQSSKTSDRTKAKLKVGHDNLTDRIVDHHKENPYRKYHAKGTELPDHYTETKKKLTKDVSAGKKAAKEKEDVRQKRLEALDTKNPFKKRKATSYKASKEFLDNFYKNDETINKGDIAHQILKAEKEAFRDATKGKSYVDEEMVKKIGRANDRIKDAKKGGSGRRTLIDTLKRYIESHTAEESEFAYEIFESVLNGTMTEEAACEIIESL